MIIITDIRLAGGTEQSFLTQMKTLMACHPAGVIFRAKELTDEVYKNYAIILKQFSEKYQVPLTLHTKVNIAKDLGIPRIHLNMK